MSAWSWRPLSCRVAHLLPSGSRGTHRNGLLSRHRRLLPGGGRHVLHGGSGKDRPWHCALLPRERGKIFSVGWTPRSPPPGLACSLSSITAGTVMKKVPTEEEGVLREEGAGAARLAEDREDPLLQIDLRLSLRGAAAAQAASVPAGGAIFLESTFTSSPTQEVPTTFSCRQGSLRGMPSIPSTDEEHLLPGAVASSLDDEIILGAGPDPLRSRRGTSISSPDGRSTTGGLHTEERT